MFTAFAPAAPASYEAGPWNMPPVMPAVVAQGNTPQARDTALGAPRANVRSPAAVFDAELFVTIHDIPIFAEHETRARDGRLLRFTYHELAAICNRCNERIRATGDYATVCIGHTSDPEEVAKGAKQPEIVGYAGPFRMGVLGEEGARQRWAILADFHIFRSDVAKLQKYPRRSPELWLEDRYEEMFLDPIALLGAEAPRLDMGLLYSAARSGRLVERYTAAAPAAGNVFIPSDDHRRRYAADPTSTGGNAMALTPQDTQQIIEALMATEPMQWVRQQMAGAPQSMVPGASPDAAGSANPAAATAGPPAAAPPAAAAGPAAAPPAPEPPAPPAPPAPEPPAADEPPPAPAADTDKEKLARQRFAAGENDDEDDDDPDLEDLMPEDEDDEDDEDEKPARYGAARRIPSEPKITRSKVKYAKLQGDVNRLQGEVETLRQRWSQEHMGRVNAERHAKLAALVERYQFDLEDESRHCAAEVMDDNAFAAHLARIEANYRPVVLQGPFPAGFAPPARQPERYKFNQSISDRAFSICEAAALRGEHREYKEVLDALHRGEKVE